MSRVSPQALLLQGMLPASAQPQPKLFLLALFQRERGICWDDTRPFPRCHEQMSKARRL